MTTRFTGILFLIASLALGACADKESAGDSSTGGGDDSTSADDTSGTESGYTISGTAYNLMAGSAASAGLCVAAADPSAAIGGGEIDILASSTVGDAGVYAVTGISKVPAVGLLMLVQDCDGGGTVMPTATGVSSSDLSGYGDGDVMSDRSIYSIDASSQANLQAGLAAAGYSGTLATDGALVGFVLDSAASPVGGATISAGSTAVYYLNADGSFNTVGTVAEARAMFVIPAAGVNSYAASATGYTFNTLLAGSQPGIAVIVRFLAT